MASSVLGFFIFHAARVIEIVIKIKKYICSNGALVGWFLDMSLGYFIPKSVGWFWGMSLGYFIPKSVGWLIGWCDIRLFQV